MDLSIYQGLINYAPKDISFYLEVNFLQFGQHPIIFIVWVIWHPLWKLMKIMIVILISFHKALKI